MKNNYASIDLGSNSCRLLIADQNRKKLCSLNSSTMLAEGLYSSGKLSDAAIRRAVNTFCLFSQKIKEFNVPAKNVRAIATAACRMASNSAELQKIVKQKSGIDIEIIDEKEEARLNLLGAIGHVCGKSKYAIVFDIGGGSTEITLAKNCKNPQILHTVSIPFGARNASECYGLASYNKENAEKLQKEISKYTTKFIEDANLQNYSDDLCFVATSSTPLRIVSIIENTGKYDREVSDGKVINVKDADKAIAETLKLSRQEMAKSPYIGENRSTIFAAACIIFQTIAHDLKAKEITASLMTAKDGIIQELTERENGKINCIGKANSR